MVRLIAWSVAIVLLVGALLLVRDWTMTTEDEPPPGSRSHLVMAVKTNAHLQPPEMARAIFDGCMTRVQSNLVPGSWRDLGDGRFEALLEPVLNPFGRRELQGCLEDFTLDHVKVVVEELGDVR